MPPMVQIARRDRRLEHHRTPLTWCHGHPRNSVQMPERANSGWSSLSANHTTSFRFITRKRAVMAIRGNAVEITLTKPVGPQARSEP